MKKKKISKEDLELNYEVLGSSSSNNTRAASNTCGDATYNTCNTNDFVTCDTTLTSVVDCKTKEDGNGCNTVNTFVCETLNCVDSQSRAELCCAITKYEGCKETADNCISAACVNSYNICPATHDVTCYHLSNDDNCDLKPLTFADNCEETDICQQPASFNCNQP